jgi:predicted DNA-binding transcriptional regulator YafY
MKKKKTKKGNSIKIRESDNPNEKLKTSVSRIIQIYELLRKGEEVFPNKICREFNISERTLRRDLKVLKDVYEAEIFPDTEKGYRMIIEE